MSSTLSITIKAVDQATAPIRRVQAVILDWANKIGDYAKKFASGMGSVLSGMFAMLTSIKAIAAGAIAALGVGKLISSFTETARAIKAVGAAAGDIGVAVDEMSKLKYIAEANNSSFEALTGGVKNFMKGLGDAAITGGSNTSRALAELGVNATDATGHMRKMTDMLPEIADKLSGISDPITKAAFAEALFGKQWQEMSRIFDGGGERMKFFANELERLGGVITPEQLRAASLYTDSIDHLKTAWEGLWQQTVTKIGPQLAEWINWAAAAVAALPDIINNVISEIKLATTDVATALQMGDVLAKTIEVFKQAGIAAGTIFMGMLRDTLTFALPMVANVLKSIGKSLVKYLMDGIADAISLMGSLDTFSGGKLTSIKDSVASVMMGMGPAGMATGAGLTAFSFQGAGRDIKAMAGGLGMEIQQDTKDFIQNVKDALTSGTSATSEAFSQAVESLMVAGKAAVQSADKVFHISEEINKHLITAPPEMKAGPSISPDASKIAEAKPPAQRFGNDEKHFLSFDFDHFIFGLHEGMDKFRDMVNNAEVQGVQMAMNISQAISENLSSAIYDVISGTKKLADAFRSMLSATLAQVSQLIIQLLVMRAVAGISGSLFSGSGASGTPMAGDNIAGSAGTFANRGGPIDFRHFALGGSVPGPGYINRDIVPAMLTPGEYVVSQRGRRANRAADLDYINRGGNARDLGGGGGVVVNVTVNVQGGGSSGGSIVQQAQQVGQAAFQGVLKALKMNPSNRDELRRVLA